MMNKTGIEYVDYTWNPVTGCYHDCGYCYARRLAETRMNDIYPNGFDYTFWEDRLDEPVGAEPSSILVSSMGDLFGKWVPDEDIKKVSEAARKVPKHDYLFLTKNPGSMWYRMSRRAEVIPPENFWFGTSVENQDSIERAGKLPTDANTFVSFEPLLGKIQLRDLLWELGRVDWVIIGAKTGPDAQQPKVEWVERILFWADDHDTPVFIKDNLKWSVKVRNFPDNYNVPDGEVE